MRNKFERAGLGRLAISEITLAELMYGTECSANPEKNKARLEILLLNLKILGIREALQEYALEKARLTKAGAPVGDFDLLIGATAIHHNMTLVTNNTRHFERLQGISLEDWTK